MLCCAPGVSPPRSVALPARNAAGEWVWSNPGEADARNAPLTFPRPTGRDCIDDDVERLLDGDGRAAAATPSRDSPVSRVPDNDVMAGTAWTSGDDVVPVEAVPGVLYGDDSAGEEEEGGDTDVGVLGADDCAGDKVGRGEAERGCGGAAGWEGGFAVADGDNPFREPCVAAGVGAQAGRLSEVLDQDLDGATGNAHPQGGRVDPRGEADVCSSDGTHEDCGSAGSGGLQAQRPSAKSLQAVGGDAFSFQNWCESPGEQGGAVLEGSDGERGASGGDAFGSDACAPEAEEEAARGPGPGVAMPICRNIEEQAAKEEIREQVAEEDDQEQQIKDGDQEQEVEEAGEHVCEEPAAEEEESREQVADEAGELPCETQDEVGASSRADASATDVRFSFPARFEMVTASGWRGLLLLRTSLTIRCEEGKCTLSAAGRFVTNISVRQSSSHWNWQWGLRRCHFGAFLCGRAC